MAKVFKTEVAVPNGSSEDPSYTFDADRDTGMFRSSSDSLGLSAGGNVNLFVDATGVRIYNRLQVLFGDVVGSQEVIHRHGTSRETSMMDLEVMNWM